MVMRSPSIPIGRHEPGPDEAWSAPSQIRDCICTRAAIRLDSVCIGIVVPIASLRAKIHRVDPYAGASIEGRKVDMQGWGSTHPVFDVLLPKLRPRVIMEVGTWKGASAINMATICKKHDIACEIICVDTWLGSPGLYTRPGEPFYDSLAHVNGYPNLYYTNGPTR